MSNNMQIQGNQSVFTHCMNRDGLKSLNLFYIGRDLAEFSADRTVTWCKIHRVNEIFNFNEIYISLFILQSTL